MFYLLSFLYGAAIGSFTLVVATRLHVAPVLKSRSKCLSCGETLRFSDLIPIVSYLVLKGKCRYCKTSYGFESIFVEVAFGVVFTLLYHTILSNWDPVTALLWLLYYTILFISIGIIALYDYKHSYVPVLYLGIFSFLSLCMLLVRYAYEPSLSLLLGPLIVSLPFLMMWMVTRGKGLGFGDVVLYVAVGAFFGVEQGLAVLLISIWLGAIAGIGIYLYRRRRGVKNSAIPFVPFIVAGFLIVLFTDIGIFSIASLFQ